VRAADAAKILLVRAAEETVPACAAAPEADAAASKRDHDGEAAWVLHRAEHRLAGDLAPYRPLLHLAAAPYAPAVTALLPFLIGVFSNWLGAGAQIHVLYNPIAVLVAWNLALYATLALGALAWRGRRPQAPRSGEPRAARSEGAAPGHSRPPGPRGWLLRRAVPGVFFRLRRGARDAAAGAARAGAVARRFWSLWLDAAGALPAAGLRRLLHAWAAALAVGAVAGMFVRGVFFDYAMVWRSTFVRDPETVAALLQVVLGPAAAVLGDDSIGVASAEQMMGAAGLPAAGWIQLWAVTALLFVVAPRLALAAAASLRRRAAARRASLDLDDAYFEALLAGVRRIQIERIEAAIGEDVRRETQRMVDALADFTCERLFDERLVPQLRAFRERGGSVQALEQEMEAECGAFQPELDAKLERARADFETALRIAIERTLGRSFGPAEPRVALDAGGLPTSLGGAMGREISASVGAAVSAGVSLVVATLSGGFGHHLGAAILVTLLHTTGPVGFLIGGLGGLAVAAAGWYLGRDRLASGMKGVRLPRSLARVALRERALEKLVVQGREQCRTAVRDRLGAELAPLVPQLAEEIWTKLRPSLPRVPAAASAGGARP
jgi:hypothetical protein